MSDRRARARTFAEVYAKHAVLNLGQALQGVRYLHSHPDADPVAQRGSLRHVGLSLAIRGPRVLNDLLFAVLPPQTHHSREELSVFPSVPVGRWFQYGYCAWRFDDRGQPREDAHRADPRWDPRCRGPAVAGERPSGDRS